MLYDMMGEFFKDIGQFSMAQNLLETSLELKETHLEPDDNLLRKSHFLLAKLFTQWKKYQTAEEYLKQALIVKEVSELALQASKWLPFEILTLHYLNHNMLCKNNNLFQLKKMNWKKSFLYVCTLSSYIYAPDDVHTYKKLFIQFIFLSWNKLLFIQ